MPRSLANGDYRLLMAIESSSRPNSWYRVLIEPRTNALSCDCPAWTFGARGATVRECKHTDLALLLLRTQTPTPGTVNHAVLTNAATAPAVHPLIAATRQQWAGLNGAWTIEERDQRFGGASYHFVLLRLVTGNGVSASGVVAFASAFHPTTQSMVAGVSGWAGYAIAAEVARRAGYALAGQPPQHFKTERRAAGRGAPREEDLSLMGILRVGDQVNLGDGLSPKQRAENTLRLFLGDLYPQLERQGFLDVPSACFTIEQRVYRLRRDPNKQYERRVRCFERGRYVRDYCIKRAQDVPEADHWLTVFLGLISDEREVLSVVYQYNIFQPNSDGREPEPIAAVWMARAS
jgi:hypothetical protein